MPRSATLKSVVQSRRESLYPAATPSRRTRPTVVSEHCVSPVVAVRRESPASGPQIVVRIAVIDGQRGVEIPGQLLVELVPHRNRVQVSRIARSNRVEVMFSTRVTRSSPRVPVADADVIPGAEQVLGRCEPPAGTLPLVLELQYCRDVPAQRFPDTTD